MRSYHLLNPETAKPTSRFAFMPVANACLESDHSVIPEFCQLSDRSEVHYFRVIPDELHEKTPVVVVVHGISRHAREYAAIFSGLAEDGKAIVIAPLFDEAHFKGYQRPGLAAVNPENQSNLALDDILAEVQSEYGVDTSTIRLFGFSGGAQFSQRFALLHPERVARLVIAAPGWFTMPDSRERYPYGLGVKRLAQGAQLHLNKTLPIPTLLLSGGADVYRDAGLNKSARVDGKQGRTRLERAHNWYTAMHAYAEESGLTLNLEHEVIPGAGHDFIENVRQDAVIDRLKDFLAG